MKRKPLVHGTRHGYESARCRCAECRAAWAAACREYAAKRKALGHRRQQDRRRWPRSRTPYAKKCEMCGASFGAAAKRQKFCSNRCRAAASRAGLIALSDHDRRRRHSRELVGPVVRGAPVQMPRLAPRWYCGPCAWCGEVFITKHKGRFCSARCSNSHHSRAMARERGYFYISRRDRLAIYERDGWICQLCFTPVDPNVSHRDKLSATLDHIEPQSSALVPDHSPANLRLAHLWCNAARGDGRRDNDEIPPWIKPIDSQDLDRRVAIGELEF